jgi:hypothetical protein
MRSSAIALLLGCGLTCVGFIDAAHAQSPVANKPSPKVGDQWRFRTIDLWTERETGALHSELVEITADRYVERRTGPTDPQARAEYRTHEWNPCRALKGSDAEYCGGAYRFPMTVGAKYQYEKSPWTNGEGYFSSKCEVSAYERVKVPAGEFDAFKIACNGFWSRVVGGSTTGRYTELYWYSPQVNRTVASETVSFRSNGNADNKTRSELVEYLPAK